MYRIDHAIESFEQWLKKVSAGTFTLPTLSDALRAWAFRHTPEGGIYVTGGDYTVFLQVATYEYSKVAHDPDAFKDVFPREALVGRQRKAGYLEKDADLLDRLWYQREVICHCTHGRPDAGAN